MENQKRSRKEKKLVNRGKVIVEIGSREWVAYTQRNWKITRRGIHVQKKNRKAVIDYVLTNTIGLDKIQKFQVGSRIDSDHQSLNMTVKTRRGNRLEENEGRIKEKVGSQKV